MAVIENSVDIQRSAADVFDYCVDLTNELEWNPLARSMEKVTEGPIAVGSKYRARWKRSPEVEVEYVRYDRPRSWRCVNGGPPEVTFDADVTPRDDGAATLRVVFDARPKGLFTLLFPIVLRQLRRTERANMGYIKTALESKAVLGGNGRGSNAPTKEF